VPTLHSREELVDNTIAAHRVGFAAYQNKTADAEVQRVAFYSLHAIVMASEQLDDDGRSRLGGFALGERYAYPVFLAPDDVAMPADIVGHNVQRDLMWDADRTLNVQSGAGRRHIANCAIDSGTVELNRSGLEYSLSGCCTSFGHTAVLS
jgi:hypothetical protein